MHFADAERADVPALVALVNAAYRMPGDTAGWTDERGLLEGPRVDAAMLGDALADARFLLLRPDHAGPIVGCVCVSTGRNGTWLLSMVAVAPDRQGAGLGAALLAEVERQARQAGALNLGMTVIAQREALIAWYERRGFRRTGETLAFPADPRVGRPLRDDLALVILEKSL